MILKCEHPCIPQIESTLSLKVDSICRAGALQPLGQQQRASQPASEADSDSASGRGGGSSGGSGHSSSGTVCCHTCLPCRRLWRVTIQRVSDDEEAQSGVSSCLLRALLRFPRVSHTSVQAPSCQRTVRTIVPKGSPNHGVQGHRKPRCQVWRMGFSPSWAGPAWLGAAGLAGDRPCLLHLAW